MRFFVKPENPRQRMGRVQAINPIAVYFGLYNHVRFVTRMFGS
jgi:hypothetical protein